MSCRERRAQKANIEIHVNNRLRSAAHNIVIVSKGVILSVAK